MLKSKHPESLEKTIVRIMGYEDEESTNNEAIPRAKPSSGMVHVDARRSVDPKEFHMDCGGDASVHTS